MLQTAVELTAAVVMILVPIGALLFLILVPVAFGLMAYDIVASRKRARALPAAVVDETSLSRSHEAARGRIHLERGFARAFVIAGGVFWAIGAFAGLSAGGRGSMAFLGAAVPLVATLVTLGIGWYWERVAAALLVLASVGAVYYGVTAQFELGVWALVTITLIGPMLTAATLFWLARREYEALQFRLAHPELAVATVKASAY